MDDLRTITADQLKALFKDGADPLRQAFGITPMSDEQAALLIAIGTAHTISDMGLVALTTDEWEAIVSAALALAAKHGVKVIVQPPGEA